MKVTVVFEDGVIIVDYDAKFGFDIPPPDSNWVVIQWQETYGWIEVIHGERVWLTDISVVQPYIDMWNAQQD